jgi:integrase
MGTRLLALLAERGTEALPPKTVAAYWSTRLQQHLVRHVSAWSVLLEEAKATAQGHLTIYSLRHGYAWRGGQTYGISPRILAALMGHTVAVHLKHYGEGAAADEVTAAVAAATSRVLASSKLKEL